MPKVKGKGRRHYHFQPKNGERKHQQRTLADITNTSVGGCDRAHPNCSFENLKSDIRESNQVLPQGWCASVDSESNIIQLSRVSFHPPQPPTVDVSLNISADFSWCLSVYGRDVPISAAACLTLQPKITSLASVENMLTALNDLTICPGNAEQKYIAVLQKRGGVIRNVSGVKTAYIDDKGKEQSVRHENCEILTLEGSRCSVCEHYRNTLRALASKDLSASDPKSQSQRTGQNSHTNYRYLSVEESKERMRNLQKAKRSISQENRRLREKLQNLIEKEGIDLVDEDVSTLEEVFEDADKEITHLPAESFQSLFWEQQRQYKQLKNKRSIRWHPLMIRFALNLKYLSSAAYRAIGQFFTLPSDRTLRDYTHFMRFDAGTSPSILQRLKEDMNFSECTVVQKKVALLIDEMKVKSGLVFSKSSGRLVGFVDLGKVNEDLSLLATSLGSEGKPPQELAKHMLVLMVRTISKPSFSFPVTQYPSGGGIKGEQLFPIVWETIEALELNGLHVVSVTSDGASANRKFYSICAESDEVPYRVRNPYRSSQFIYLFCDAPHALKTTRNCFSNSSAHRKSRRLMKNGREISWKHIESLYLSELNATHPGVRLCPKLTKNHIWLNPYTRMRVNLAAQVLSSTVADALTFEDRDDTIETRQFIRMMDMFFDCLNVRNTVDGKVKRKDFRKPYRSQQDERFKWLRTTFLGYLNEWKEEIEAIPKLKAKEKAKYLLSKQTQQALQITELAPQLLGDGLEYLLSEVFSQDPLETYFSRQRHRGGSCDNPEVQDFYYSTATLVQQREVYRDLKTMNVQKNTSISHDTCFSSLPKRKRSKVND